MFENIEDRIVLAISGDVYNVYGGVSYTLDYENKKVKFVVYDKPSRCPDKKEKFIHTFDYDVKEGHMEEIRAIHDIVLEIEKVLYNQYVNNGLFAIPL